jgi:hypothetical protein
MFVEGFLFITFAMQLALYYSLFSFLLSLLHVKPFIISEYNAVLFANYFMHGSQNCRRYLL